jgi:hypothetical protein
MTLKIMRESDSDNSNKINVLNSLDKIFKRKPVGSVHYDTLYT